jgi:hypothetical protein
VMALRSLPKKRPSKMAEKPFLGSGEGQRSKVV